MKINRLLMFFIFKHSQGESSRKGRNGTIVERVVSFWRQKKKTYTDADHPLIVDSAVALGLGNVQLLAEIFMLLVCLGFSSLSCGLFAMMEAKNKCLHYPTPSDAFRPSSDPLPTLSDPFPTLLTVSDPSKFLANRRRKFRRRMEKL